MILFKEDWNKPQYQGAIIDYDTPNKTFLDIVGLLEQMNVENRFFPLALVNPLLKGIDPHDPDLTDELKMLIAIECKINPWYFFREVAKAGSSGGLKRSIRANRANISLWWLFFNHVTTLLIQPRQTGKSFGADWLNVYNLQISCIDTTIFLYTKDDALRVVNIARIKGFMDELPDYLDFRTKKDLNNTEAISVKALGNNYKTAVARASTKDAGNIGRGMTIGIVQVDEGPFCINARETFSGLMPAHTAAREAAKVAGNPYGIVYTTTCGYLSTESGKFFKDIYDESLPWNEKLFDCKNEEELINIVKKNNMSRLSEATLGARTRAPVQVLLEYNHRQLGYTDEWLFEQLELTKAEGDTAKAEFLNKWVRGSESSPISQEHLEIINNSLEPEPYCDINAHLYITNWYISKEEFEARCPNRYLVLALDPSEAVGQDDIGLVLRDVVTGECIAVGKYNETNIFTFGKWLVWWLLEFPNLVMVPERKNMGAALIDLLIEECASLGIDAFKRIFNWVVDECDEMPDFKEVLKTPVHQRDASFYLPYRKHFGYSTAGSGKASRDNIYNRAFNSSIKNCSSTIRDRSLINQLNNLIFKNGRIDHKPNHHDDLVFSWCLNYWFMAFARNKQYYGIPPNVVLMKIKKEEIKRMGGEEALRKQEEALILRNKLIALKKYITTLTSQLEIERYTAVYTNLLSKLDDKDDEVFNIDDIKNKLIQAKKINGPKGTFIDRMKDIYK